MRTGATGASAQQSDAAAPLCDPSQHEDAAVLAPRPLEQLPCALACEFKYLCYRAAAAGAHTASGKSREAALEVVRCLVHCLAIDHAECDGLSSKTRELLKQLAWGALPSLWDVSARARFEALRTNLLAADDLAPSLRGHLVEAAEAAAEHIFEVRLRQGRDPSLGWAQLARFVWAIWRCYWRRLPWRGANLGGWLLLEPGPSYKLWQSDAAAEASSAHSEAAAPSPSGVGEAACNESGDGGGNDGAEDEEDEKDEEDGEDGGDDEEHEEGGEEDDDEEEAEDEHGMCVRLGDQREAVLKEYRETWLDEKDFEWLFSRGFNSVRVPFGYWIVTGPTHGDPYVGPALECLDRVVDLAERHGMQVVLDLHGNPGGESGDAPCGRKWDGWSEGKWRRSEALVVLGKLAARYASRRAVTGVQVANEPAGNCDMGALCDWYEEAIDTIRKAGMTADCVAVVLPVYWYDRLKEFMLVWLPRGNFLRFDNVAIDLHLYHCFGAGWESLDHRDHIRTSQRHKTVLQSLPGACVCEWSLARPPHVLATDAMEREFAEAQLSAYSAASHGWFFWTYSDQADHWDLETCFRQGWLVPGALGPETTEGPGDLDRAFPARTPPPSRFPGCYGADFSQLPGDGAGGRLHGEVHDPAVAEEMRTRAAALAEATGQSYSDAAAALAACGGDPELAAGRLLQLAAAGRLAEAVACSRERAAAALQACGGNEARAAARLLDGGGSGGGGGGPSSSSPRGHKRPHDGGGP